MSFDIIPEKKYGKMKQFRRAIRARLLPLLDVILSPFVFVSALILKRIRKTGVHKLPISKYILMYVGVFPIMEHYYEPLFNYKNLKSPLSTDRELPGIDWNIEGQLEILDQLSFGDELADIDHDKTSHLKYYLNNGAFGPGEAEYWYGIIRLKKPKRIIEIGSGKSTLLAIRAIRANQDDDPTYECEHTCIEPYAAPWLADIDVNVIREPVERIDNTIFNSLEKNDILFIDSSHIIRAQGDVVFEYLQLLPSLNTGVIVHVHDIFTPKDYPEDWLIEKVSFWNEQYLLEAFLTHNSAWIVIGALNYLFHHHNKELSAKLPYLTNKREPRSFYLQKSA